MIRFGLHLTLRGGREAVVRLLVTALAVALRGEQQALSLIHI